VTTNPNSAIYEGTTTHVRRKPIRHRLQYGLFSLLIDLDELDDLGSLRFFSHNRTNLVSFFDEDHGARDGGDLRQWITAELAEAGIHETPGRIRLLCLPRIAGYEFNPLTIWFIDDEGGEPRWILYEIHNTFGEAHSHLVEVNGSDRHRHGFRKEFYVSPFFDVEGGYRVTISQPGARISIAITYEVDDETVFTATLAGRRIPLTSKTLLGAVIRYPLITFKVMAAIHWEAAKLWLKGARYRRRPAPPVDSVSVPTKLAA
jgi:uncharacterized protein